jgi:hypothetical protein
MKVQELATTFMNATPDGMSIQNRPSLNWSPAVQRQLSRHCGVARREGVVTRPTTSERPKGPLTAS